ncbi:hypothetical protein [uncultured Winogradskyella sp.]
MTKKKVKNRIDAVAHQSSTPRFDTIPVNGLTPKVDKGSSIISLMGMS